KTMRESGQDILVKIKQRWQMKLWAEVLFYALGAAILTWFLFHWLLLSILAFAITGFLFALLKKPWELSVQHVSSYIDLHLDSLEYSTGLLLIPEEQLSGIAKLQQEKVSREIDANKEKIKPKNDLLKAVIISATLILAGLMLNYSGITEAWRT